MYVLVRCRLLLAAVYSPLVHNPAPPPSMLFVPILRQTSSAQVTSVMQRCSAKRSLGTNTSTLARRILDDNAYALLRPRPATARRLLRQARGRSALGMSSTRTTRTTRTTRMLRRASPSRGLRSPRQLGSPRRLPGPSLVNLLSHPAVVASSSPATRSRMPSPRRPSPQRLCRSRRASSISPMQMAYGRPWPWSRQARSSTTRKVALSYAHPLLDRPGIA
jgi:hypothetical protein